MESPRTLQAAIIHFKEFENCKSFMMELRWPDGIVRCPHCGSEKVTWLENARIWKCYTKHDRPRFSLKTGTIFEDSPHRARQVAYRRVARRELQKRNQQLRSVARSRRHAEIDLVYGSSHSLCPSHGSFDKLSGEVEADETFIGGKARNMHKDVRARKITGTGGKDKTAVMGILERGGKVRTSVVPNRKKNALQSEVRKHVEAGSALYTDALNSYRGLDEFEHGVVDHAVQ